MTSLQILQTSNTTSTMRSNGTFSVASEDKVAADTREILLDFIQRSDIASHFGYTGVPAAVKDKFFSLVHSYNLGLQESDLIKFGILGLNMAITAYRHTPFDTQVAIAMYTFLGILIDEDIMSIETIREFPPRLFDGRPQLHPCLTRFVETLASMRDHFPPYSANIITTNTVDFVSAEMLTRDGTQGGPDGKATGYADYIRLKTGLGETYAAFIWPREQFPHTRTYVQTFPHVAEYACFGNDMYSFYKEYCNGEAENYMSYLARAHGQNLIEAVRTTADRLIEVDRRIKTILGDGPEKKAWESFTAGYAEFHLHTSRYRLRELLPEYYL